MLVIYFVIKWIIIHSGVNKTVSYILSTIAIKILIAAVTSIYFQLTPQILSIVPYSYHIRSTFYSCCQCINIYQNFSSSRSLSRTSKFWVIHVNYHETLRPWNRTKCRHTKPNQLDQPPPTPCVSRSSLACQRIYPCHEVADAKQCVTGSARGTGQLTLQITPEPVGEMQLNP